MELSKENLQAIPGLLDVNFSLLTIGSEVWRILFGSVENQLEKLGAEVSAIKLGQTEIRRDIIWLERGISDAYQLAFDAWDKSTKNRSRLDQSKLHV